MKSPSRTTDAGRPSATTAPASSRGRSITIIDIARHAVARTLDRVITVDLGDARIVGWAPTGTWSDGVGFSRVVAEH